MDRSTQLLRIRLDGRWQAGEMGRALSAISNLYDIRLVLELAYEDQRDWAEWIAEILHSRPIRHRWKRRMHDPRWMFPTFVPQPLLSSDQVIALAEACEPSDRLELRRIEYASPGFGDFAGLGAVVGHIKEFAHFLIEHRSGRKNRDLETARLDIENMRLRLENASRLIALVKELGMSEIEIRQLLLRVDGEQAVLDALVQQRKLVAVEDVDESDTSPGERPKG